MTRRLRAGSSRFEEPRWAPEYKNDVLTAVLRIRIRRVHMFLGLPDPNPGPLVRDLDPDPDHQAKIVRKTLIPTVL